MKLILSRKGVDSGSGRCASPILDGVPRSIPIPTSRQGATTTYRQLGLAEAVARTGRLDPDQTCHEDPMFGDGICAFGQTGAAQSHLSRQGVGAGDVFLFFGLFCDADGRDRHHRVFGYLEINSVVALGAQPKPACNPSKLPRLHPHTLGAWNDNNTLYVGRGHVVRRADAALRLSAPDSPVSLWTIPAWLKDAGLTFHGNADRWLADGRLRSVGRGQEFVTEIRTEEAHNWLNEVLELIR